MARPVTVIGIDSGELRWIRTLVALLRHPDPSVPELARQALLYLTDAAAQRVEPSPSPGSPKPGPDKSELVKFNTLNGQSW
jgi:hypothetical protein